MKPAAVKADPDLSASPPQLGAESVASATDFTPGCWGLMVVRPPNDSEERAGVMPDLVLPNGDDGEPALFEPCESYPVIALAR